MSGIVTVTGRGIGLSIAQIPVRMRNAAATAVAKGDIMQVDLSATTTGVEGAHSGIDKTDWGERFNAWSNVVDPTNTNTARMSWPCVVAAEPVPVGMVGMFWLSHPDVECSVSLNAAGNGGVIGGVMILDTLTPTRTLMYASLEADLPAIAPAVTGFAVARICGWGNETVAGAGLRFCAFDGLHLGLLSTVA